uniref:hemagglutinin repeat-containing protein n=1 Tax=Leptotrichia trevisanii TaxID=109328 RepID=UPI00047E7119
RQTNYVNGSVGAKGARDAMANSNFYANIGVNAGFTRSRSNTSSHTEGAAVTTLKPMDENSSITYSNVNNITYQGTQAQGGTFIYNNVANIQKEAVELHNSYSSSSSSRGINAGATIGYGHKIQTTGNGGSISASQSNQNTVETVYANGNFKNVNEVHNNTGSMVLNGFNQEGGKVTGNIGKLVVESRQNTSTTTGSSRGIGVGISANGMPSSVNVSGSRTNGDRAFVDNQSTFIVGEGSNLHVGTLENTGSVVGKEGNSTFKIDSYIGKDIQNHDTMKTTGGSLGISTGKPRITNVGFNQDSRDKQGIARNTVVGDVEIVKAEGSPINRDLGKANEVTRDTHSSTNINVESQTIEYLTNPAKLREDIGKAKKEIADVKKAIKESINDRGDDNRNFFGQLREVRLSETVNNIAGKRLNEADKSEDVVAAWKDAYKDLGYNLDVKYTTGEDTPEMKNKAGTAYVSKDGVHTIIININAKENSTKAGLIGTLAEEASHIVNGVAGRQIATGTEEKGLESTGRAANAYFKEEYKGSNQNMTYKSDGKIDTSKLGTNVGDYELIRQMIYHSKAPNSKEAQAVIDGIDKGIRNTWNTITKHPEIIAIGAGIAIGVTGNPSLGLKIATLPSTNNNKTSGKSNTNSAPVASQTKPTSKLPVKSSTSRGRGRGKKKKNNNTNKSNEEGEQNNNRRKPKREKTKNHRKSNPDTVKSAQERYEEAQKEYKELKSKTNKTKEDKELLDKAEGKMKDALDDMSKSAEHSRAGKGQSNKGSGKVRR